MPIQGYCRKDPKGRRYHLVFAHDGEDPSKLANEMINEMWEKDWQEKGGRPKSQLTWKSLKDRLSQLRKEKSSPINT